jgi:DNA-binding MarR family transcriptional regulator
VPVDPDALDLPTLVSLAGAASDRFLIDRLRTAGFDGIRLSHGYVIQRLIEASPTINELAAQLGVTQQAASKTVVEMEGLGLVERRADAVDSRMRRVALSDRGRAVLEAGRAARRELEASLDSPDLAAARRTLVALLDRTGALDEVRGRRARLPAL